MKRAPELLIWIAPLAIAGGVALAIALHGSGGVLAWCIATACAVACLFAVVAGIQYARHCKSSVSRDSAAQYFANWPSEMDVLFSGTTPERRASALESLEKLARDPKWKFREDFVKALQFIIASKDEDSKLVSVASGAMAKLESGDDPPGQVDRDPQFIPTRVTEPLVGRALTRQPTYVVLKLVLEGKREGVIVLRRDLTGRPFVGEDITRQWQEGARKPLHDRILYATQQATLNREQFPPEEKVAERMLQRSVGREWLDVSSEEELQMLAGEPWFLALQETLHVQSERLIIHFWPLVSQSGEKGNRRSINELLGTFGSKLLRLKRQS